MVCLDRLKIVFSFSTKYIFSAVADERTLTLSINISIMALGLRPQTPWDAPPPAGFNINYPLHIIIINPYSHSIIKEEKDLKGGEINDELIEKVYNYRILGSEGKHYFEHYSQRLRIFYQGMSGMEEKAARAILRRTCSTDYYPVNLAFGIFKQETGIDDYEKFIELIADLSNGFYIERDHENRLKFYSKMLMDW